MNAYSPYEIAALLTFASTGSLAFFVLTKGAGHTVARLFGVYTLAISAWSFGWFKMISAGNYEAGLFWCRLLHFAATFIPTTFLSFVQYLLGIEKEKKHVIVRRLLYGIGLVFPAATFAPGFVKTVVPKLGFHYYLEPGPYYLTFFLYFVIGVTMTLTLLLMAYKASNGFKRNQIMFVLVAYVLGYTGGTEVFLPAYGLSLPSAALYLIPLCHVIIAYTIFTKRLMDVELLARDTMTQILSWGLVGLPFVIGMVLGHFLNIRQGFFFQRGSWDLICVGLNYSLALALLRNYKNPLYDRLRWCFMLLGTWELSILVLTAPSYPWASVVYRSGYGLGAFLVFALFAFWEKFFENAKDGFSYVLHHSLLWTAGGMAILSVFTPRVISGLKYNITGQLAAKEMPGPLYTIYGIWFVMFLIVMTVWSICAIRQLPEETPKTLVRWILAAQGMAISAAAAYFFFAIGKISWRYYTPIEAVMCICLAGCLSHRMQKTAHPVDLRFGAATLVIPFATGLLMPYSLVASGCGALLLARFASKIVGEIEKSIRTIVDRLFGDRYTYLTEIEQLAQDIYRWTNLSGLLEKLVKDLVSRARLQWAGVWLFDVTKGAHALLQAAGFASRKDIPTTIWISSFGPLSPMIQYFGGHKELLVTEDLHNADTIDDAVQKELHQSRIAAAMPMYSENRLIGFIGFGSKLDKGSFHQGDLESLTDLGVKAQGPIAQAYMLFEQSIMLSKLAHDLKNFVNSQGIALEKVYEGGDLNETQKTHLAIVWKQKNLIQENICDLLELERLVVLRMQGKWRVQSFDLAGLAKEALTAYESKASAKAITMIPHLDIAIKALGDPRVIRRALDNLLINALKFTPKGGQIELTAFKAGKNIRITLKDNGPGIQPEDLPRIFDPLFQGKNQKLAQGTGLGLALVKEVAMIHKGSVKVESIPGQVTVFILELPSVERRDEFIESFIEVNGLDLAA